MISIESSEDHFEVNFIDSFADEAQRNILSSSRSREVIVFLSTPPDPSDVPLALTILLSPTISGSYQHELVPLGKLLAGCGDPRRLLCFQTLYLSLAPVEDKQLFPNCFVNFPVWDSISPSVKGGNC